MSGDVTEKCDFTFPLKWEHYSFLFSMVMGLLEERVQDMLAEADEK